MQTGESRARFMAMQCLIHGLGAKTGSADADDGDILEAMQLFCRCFDRRQRFRHAVVQVEAGELGIQPAGGFVDHRLMHAPELRRQRFELGLVDAFRADAVPVQARGVDVQQRLMRRLRGGVNFYCVARRLSRYRV